ncbi:hypothetical protein [Pseudoduganella chitinolytica]|uniref:Transposase n=1 Tax=Pseudoduganella chitinolytica TaxID=34070 RepID=A0ABY8BHR4_9BURK|nr:hypothetical protein [Pseudoduganella chitinolytica]WEF35506.1 hypothetical protein PX653_12380 [Pseudoduganella chitinolytica]
MKTIQSAVVGVAAGQRKLAVALLVDGKLKTKVLDSYTDQSPGLVAWVRKQKSAPETVHFCLVQGDSSARDVAIGLYDAGLHVSFVEADDVRAYADAEGLALRANRPGADLIARYCAARRPEAWVAPSRQQRAIDELRRELAELEAMRDDAIVWAEEVLATGTAGRDDEAFAHSTWLDESIDRLRKSLAELVEPRADESTPD